MLVKNLNIAERVEDVSRCYSDSIEDVISTAVVIQECELQLLCNSDIHKPKKNYVDVGKTIVIEQNVVDCINEELREGNSVTVLNFASYKNPGGMYLKGSTAQEETLCKHSTLYNVLSAFDSSFYARNRSSLNYGLYKSNMLLAIGVDFFGEDIHDYRGKANVITMAAPNAGVAAWNGIPVYDINKVICERLSQIYKVAAISGTDVLIVGAYGCGVFKNDAKAVASCVAELSKEYKDYFKKIIHPVIGDNFKIFYDVIDECLKRN